MLTLLGFALVQAATVCALVEVDEGGTSARCGRIGLLLRRFRPLLAGLAAAVAICVVLSATESSFPSRSGSQ